MGCVHHPRGLIFGVAKYHLMFIHPSVTSGSQDPEKQRTLSNDFCNSFIFKTQMELQELLNLLLLRFMYFMKLLHFAYLFAPEDVIRLSNAVLMRSWLAFLFGI